MRRFLLLIIGSIPLFSVAQESDKYTIVGVYDGPAFRPPHFENAAELSFEILTTKGYSQSDHGISLNYDMLPSKAASYGFKYYQTLFPVFPILYAAVEPCYFTGDNGSGWNIRPEIGFFYDPIWQSVIGLRLKLTYGYDIPLSGQNYFTANRNVIEFKLAVTFNVHHSTNY